MSEENLSEFYLEHARIMLATFAVQDLGLSIRAQNALLRSGAQTALDVQDLINRNALREVRNIGPAAESEITARLSSLLESEGLDLDLRELSAFAGIEDDPPEGLPLLYLSGLPVDILDEALGKELLGRLKNAGFQTLDELISVAQSVSEFLYGSYAALDRITRFQSDRLAEKLEQGRLHRRAMCSGVLLEDLVMHAPESHREKLAHLDRLIRANEATTLTDELASLFDLLRPGDATDFLDYFKGRTTLDEVGRRRGVTRERVRQITSRACARLWDQLGRDPGLCLQSALLFGDDMSDRLTLDMWEELLRSRGLIRSGDLIYETHPFDAYCALLRSSIRAKNLRAWALNTAVTIALNSDRDVSPALINAVESTPKKTMREIRRRISYTGGIHVIEVSELLDQPAQFAARIMQITGYREVGEGWYTVAAHPGQSRWPILKGGLAMMEVCGPLEFESFCDGIRRYISRFYDAIAPPVVMRTHLRRLGFRIEDEIVTWKETPTGYLADSDLCFVKLVEQRGVVVAFQEVIEAFQDEGFSIPTAASRVLPQSPIVERVDLGLYKLRGTLHTDTDIETAKGRLTPIDYSPEVEYGLDGITRYRVSVNSWALSGVLAVSASQQPLPNLGRGWDIYVGGEHLGTIRSDDMLLWGLGGAFGALNLQMGDRIELAFDAWDRPQVRIRRL